MRQLFLLFLSLYGTLNSFSQITDSTSFFHKGKFYILWGYNRDWYAKSDIHFRNKDGDPSRQDNFGVYDFKIYDAVAHDRPDFDKLPDVINITVPQFNFRIGYYLDKKCTQGFEINYDHAKYVVDNYQTVRMKGEIFGSTIDKDTILDPLYFHFEHTDGANFWLINYVRRFSLFESLSGRSSLGMIAKAGAGFVMPRTDVTIFGNRINNNWHIAGPCAGVEAGMRAVFFRHLSFELTAKTVIARYIDCLVQGKGHGQASQTLKAAEVLLNIGYTF